MAACVQGKGCDGRFNAPNLHCTIPNQFSPTKLLLLVLLAAASSTGRNGCAKAHAVGMPRPGNAQM